MADEKTILEFTPPNPDSPGYLRRAKQSLIFREQIKKGASPEVIDAMVDFLLPYVKRPVDRKEAREALFDATEAQFLQLVDIVGGNHEENPTSAQPTSEPSSTGPTE